MKTRLDRNRLRHIFVVLLLLVAATAAHAGTVSGVVRNGTDSNKPAAGVDVLLIGLRGGMQTVASTKTDAEGRYHFDSTAIGAAPMMIRAVYRGMNFHQPITPGAPTVDVTVYELTTNPQALQITMRILVFQPNREKLQVGEEYSIQNNSNPPVAYYKQDGNFEFTIPQGAQIEQVSTVGPSGMPVTQGTIDKGKGRYAIAYVFQPGQNGVRLSYTVPYTGNQASLREASSYDAQRVLLVIPPTMQILSPGFNAAGMEQGFNVFSKESVKAGTGFDVSISGTAPPQSEASGAPDQTNGSGSGPGPTVEIAPARLDGEKWILLGGLAAIFAVGVGLLLRRPAPAVPSALVPASPSSGPRERKAQRAAQAQSKTKSAAMPATLAEKVDQEVDTNLNLLKDTLLRIELRRQAGTISEEEYARERGRAEQMLRDLVQG